MVLLIKNKHASVEDFAHLSHAPAGDTSRKRLARLSMQNLRNAGVPKAMSMPHISLLAEGGSLKAHCSAVLNADLQNLKPGKLFARKVKSAKEDLRRLFDNPSLKQPVDPARAPSDSISTAASHVGTPNSLDPSSAPPITVPALLDDQDDDDDDDHFRCLTVVAQSWLDFERLFTRRRALFDPTIEEARHDFCQALIQSFSDRSPAASSPEDGGTPLQVTPSPGNHLDLPSAHPAAPVFSPASSAITLANQTTLTVCSFDSTAPEKLAQSPEFSDEDLERDFDNFSFDSSQEEEWTSEVESKKQNAINRALSDMKRKLAVPVPKLSSYFSDDSLADSAAHRTLVNPQASCSGASSKVADNSSIYSADQEDDVDEDDESIVVSPPYSPVCIDTATVDVDATIVPSFPAEPLLSSQMYVLTSNEKQDVSSPRIAHIEDGTDDVWQVLAVYVPTLLTRIPEESFADEYEIEATVQPPPLSFERPISEYRNHLQLRRQCTSLLDDIDQVDSKPAAPLAESIESPEAASSNVGASFTTTTDTDSDPSSSSVASFKVSFQNYPEKSLRRVRKFADLKNPIILPTLPSTSSIETLCDTASLHEEACPPESQARRLRRVPGCLNLRKACGGMISTETPPSLSGLHGHSLQRCLSFKERHHSSDLEETCENRPVSPRCHILTREDSAKPPLPPKPPGFRLHRKRIHLSSATIQEPSSLCSGCDRSSSLPLWSCAKITRSKGKQGRGLKESTKVLKKRLASICIDPETIHGHPPQSCCQKIPFIPSINEIRKGKTLKNIWKTQTKESDRHAQRRKAENFSRQERHISLVTWENQSRHSRRNGSAVTVDVF